MRRAVIVLLILATTTTKSAARDSRLPKELKERLLSQDNETQFLISFATGTEDVLRVISSITFPDRTSKLQALTQALMANSVVSQANVRALLDEHGVYYDVLWIQDQLYVKGNVTEELFEELLTFPEIKEILPNELTFLHKPLGSAGVVERPAPMAEWGIVKIHAEAAMEYLHNVTDSISEIRVAIIDSGVRSTHEALTDSFLGSHGWFDPARRRQDPYDTNGHGTHVAGTVAGTNGIGVFPESKWSMCVGCEHAIGLCSYYAMIRCGQWVLCPTDPDGESNMNCSKSPHVVSNSWGVVYVDPNIVHWYDGVVAAWNVGGIIPVFAMGNSGPQCSTVAYPAALTVIAVGATTSMDESSSFSSRGPIRDGGRFKPDISAPGSNIYSASHTSDTGYRSLSGTSMACPHAAGMAGILKAYDPDLTLEEIREAMTEGAEQTALTTSGQVCGGIPDTTFPNHVFGHGRIDALSSLEYVVAKRSIPVD